MGRGDRVLGNLSDRVLANVDADRSHPWTFRRYFPRLLTACGFAGLGLIAGCLAIRLAIPAPIDLYANIRSEKLSLARQWAGTTRVAVFGSSHIDQGFDPRIFDQAIGAGHPVSLNLAVSGGSQTEQMAMARAYQEMVQGAPTRRQPRLLLLELNAGTNFTSQFMVHPRAINIYDFATVRLALQFSDPALGLLRALGRSGAALADGALNVLNVGMLSSKLFPPALDTRLIQTQTAYGRRGFSPLASAAQDAQRRDLAALAKSRPSGRPAVVTPGSCAAALALQRASGGRDKVVYLVSPLLSDMQGYQIYPESLRCGSEAIPVIDMGRPDLHPELYRATLWHDDGHLNQQGTNAFSRLLAGIMLRRADVKSLLPQ